MPRDLENAKRLKHEWYLKNKEITIERARQWAIDHPEETAAKKSKWREQNRDQHNEINRRHKANNSGKYAHYEAKRRSAKLQRTPSWLTPCELERIQALYSIAAMFTRESGIEHHVDHIVPLQGESVSGLHVYDNLRILPAIENLKKSNKHDV
jgi:hypothetical protein